MTPINYIDYIECFNLLNNTICLNGIIILTLCQVSTSTNHCVSCYRNDNVLKEVH